MTAVADLLALQQTDIALDKALARLEEISAAMGEPAELQEARIAVEEKSTVLRALKSEQRDMELAIDEIRTKAADIEKKLYSGTVKNPKELQDFDADLKSLRELIRKREDEEIGVLEQVETAENELRAAEETLQGIESEWKRNQESMIAERAKIEPEVERLRSIRSEQSTDVERTILRLYDLLRDRRGGTAVARIERGMCEGCRITLPMSVLQRARTGVGVVQCVSCERILLTT